MIAGFFETAILNTTVTPNDLKIHLEHKVFELTCLPNNEGIALGGIFLGGLTSDRSVLNAPELWVAIPALEGFPIKDGLKAFFRCQSRQDKGCG